MTASDTPPEGYRPCVGIVLINRDGLVFTGQRYDTPDAWQMPQGGIDAGESVESAAYRELREETGTDKAEVLSRTQNWMTYDLPVKIAKKRWRGRFRGQAQIWVAMRFVGMDAEIDIAAHGKHAEFSTWRWSPPERVAQDIVAFKRPIYQQVLAAFEPYLLAGS